VDVVRDDTFTVLFQKNGIRYVVVTLPEHQAWLTDIQSLSSSDAENDVIDAHGRQTTITPRQWMTGRKDSDAQVEEDDASSQP